jgi:hypothetical protein
MRVFTPRDLLDVMARLETDLCLLKKMKEHNGGGVEVPERFLSTTVEHFQKALAVCSSLDMFTAHRQIDLQLVDFKTPRGSLGAIDASTLLAATGTVIRALADDLWRRSFVMVDPDHQSAIENEQWLGDSVLKAFPSARMDIREAGNCLAAECPTAAVFHLMRVTEWGLRALAVDLGLLRVLKDRKKRKYVPLPWSDWEHILSQLPDKIDTRIVKLKPGPRKQALQEFYYPAIQDIKAIRDAWRNHVMHTRREYTVADAKAIREHVQRLMVTLAARVAES